MSCRRLRVRPLPRQLNTLVNLVRPIRQGLFGACALSLGVAACGSKASNDETGPGSGGYGGFGASGSPGGYSGFGASGGGSGGYGAIASGGYGAIASGGDMAFGGGQSFPNSGGQLGSSGGTGGSVADSGGGLNSGNGGGAIISGSGGTNNGGGGSGATGGSGSGNTDAGTSAGGSDCSGGHSLLASDAAGSETPIDGNAEVDFEVPTNTQILELKTTLTVPTNPMSSSTLFIWPGLEPLPGDANYSPIGIGVLQPVLTWGTSCAPNSPYDPMGWWISAQYVNPYTTDSAHYGCLGGAPIDVQVGDALDITMTLKGTVWSQLVSDRRSGQTSSYDIDMGGQAQDWALFKVEMPTQTKPSSDVIFSSTTLTFATAEPMACQPSQRGANDYFTAPMTSVDGTKCCISRIVLRAPGVPATTQNGP